MKSLMKRLTLTGLSAAFAVLALISTAKAANPQTLDIRVSITATKDLTAAATYYYFGALTPNVSSNSATAIVVTNPGATGIVETYTLLAGNAISDAGGTNWTLAASTGTDQYMLGAQFSTARPANIDGDWDATDYMTGVAQAATATRFGNGSAPESGASVAPAATRNLWFRIHTPDAITDTGAHTAQVTLAVQ